MYEYHQIQCHLISKYIEHTDCIFRLGFLLISKKLDYLTIYYSQIFKNYLAKITVCYLSNNHHIFHQFYERKV